MIDVKRLKRNSKNSREITYPTKKPVPQRTIVEEYEPFKGIDGRNYIIGYDKRLNEKTNCYAFAMGWQIPAVDPYKEYTPGFLVGQPYTLERAEELVKADLEAIGRKVYEVLYDVPEKLPEGEGYWIKFLHCKENGPMAGMHFARKDVKSGRWLHKVGWYCPPKLYVRNAEFKDRKEILFERPEFYGLPREMMEKLLVTMFPAQMYAGIELVRSEVETDDSAGYLAFDEYDNLHEYQVIWAMRVSEP